MFIDIGWIEGGGVEKVGGGIRYGGRGVWWIGGEIEGEGGGG